MLLHYLVKPETQKLYLSTLNAVCCFTNKRRKYSEYHVVTAAASFTIDCMH